MRLARSLIVVPIVVVLSACDLLGGPDRFVGVLAGASTTGVIELALPKGAAKLSGIRRGFALPPPARGEAGHSFTSTGVQPAASNVAFAASLAALLAALVPAMRSCPFAPTPSARSIKN